MKALELLYKEYVKSFHMRNQVLDYDCKKRIFARLWLADPKMIPMRVLCVCAIVNNQMHTLSFAIESNNTSINDILDKLSKAESIFFEKFSCDVKVKIDSMIDTLIKLS